MLERIKTISRADRFTLSLISIFYIILIIFTYAKWGHPVVDCFRDAYIADRLSSGALLYKDVFFFYCPLIPYLNALLFKLFGIHLNTLYISGIILCFITIITVYYLSRQLLSCFSSGIILSLLLLQVFLRPGIFQFIFPYSYEALYGSICLLFLIICFIEFVKQDFNNTKLLYIASFLTVITAFIKQDNCIAAYLTFYTFSIILLFLKKLDFKTFIKLIIITLLIPPVFYGLLTFLIPANYLFSGLFPFNIFSPFYLKYYSGTQISIEYIFTALKSLLTFILSLYGIFIVLYIAQILSSLVNEKYKSYRNTFIAILIVTVCFTTIFFWEELLSIYFSIMKFWSYHGVYQWLVMFLLVYLISKLFFHFKNKKLPDLTEYILLIYIISGILFLYRSIVAVNLQSSNNFYIFPALIVMYYFVLKVLPEKLPGINIEFYNKAITGSLLFLILAILTNFINLYNFKSIELKTARGSFYATPLRGLQIKKALELIQMYTSPNDYIFAAPEESILFFMSNRKGASRYYQLLPGIVDKITVEEEIISELEINKPVLAFITNNDVVTVYGQSQWGLDYDKRVFKYLTNNLIIIDQIKVIDPKTNENLFPYVIDFYIDKDLYSKIKKNSGTSE
ncbi:MAG: hypothetical protein AB1782_10685 [Cyanobacteriota bacterium]